MLEWRDVEDFPDIAVSEFGHILNTKHDRMNASRVNQQGIVMVGIMRDHKQHTRSVAHLVAKAFVKPMSPRFDTVIYLNGDREDCRAINLEWRTRPFAIAYHKMFNDEPQRLGVYIPRTGERFTSLRQACTTYGWVEKMASRAIFNREPIFPHGWILDEIQN